MTEKIALLGGTFDPVHIGHLNMAEWVHQELHLDRVFFIPAAHPPHKTHLITDAKHRLKMLQLATADNPHLEVSTVELERVGPSYTLHTLQKFANMHPKVMIWWIVGMDSLLSLHTWHQYEAFVNYARLAVLPRPGERVEHLNEYIKSNLSMFYGHIDFVSMPLLDISSSDIRNRLKAEKSCRYLLHQDVWQYIVGQGLYRS